MNIPATFRSEHSWNIQIWHYINIELRYSYIIKTELLPSSDNIQNQNDSFSIQLRTFYEHSHVNIHTIFILNCEGDHFWMFDKPFLECSMNVIMPTGCLRPPGHRGNP